MTTTPAMPATAPATPVANAGPTGSAPIVRLLSDSLTNRLDLSC